MKDGYREILEGLERSDEAEEAARLSRESNGRADAGDFDAAVRIAEEIGETGARLRHPFKHEALNYAAARCAEAGRIDHALEISERIDDRHKSGALFWIAIACARRGEHGRAIKIAGAISIGYVREEAMKRIELEKGRFES